LGTNTGTSATIITTIDVPYGNTFAAFLEHCRGKLITVKTRLGFNAT